MTWFIFVIMLGTYDGGKQDTFFYMEPNFPTLEDCKRYVFDNSAIIRQHMWNEYEGKSIERVFCVEEKAFKRYLELQKGTSI